MKSPVQASRIFSLDGQSPVRPKNLFVVRFRRSVPPTVDWERNLSFVVRSVDRPTVNTEVQELSQYNKKRQVYTGYKINPIKVTFYDTADNMAVKMWSEYARYHFGDFSQSTKTYAYDATTPSGMLDTGAGYGVILNGGKAGSGSGLYQNGVTMLQNLVRENQAMALGAQYFFEAIEIIEVFGGYYVQFDLVNPKITSFDSDELSYEHGETSLVTMTFAYEAVFYHNKGAPLPLSNDTHLYAMFSNDFNGNTLNVSGPVRANNYGTAPDMKGGSTDFGQAIGTILTGGALAALRGTSGFRAGGALSMFGDYVFSATNNAINSAIGVNLASVTSGLAQHGLTAIFGRGLR